TTTGEYPGTNRLEISGDRGRLIAEGGKLHFRRTRKGVSETNRTSPKAFASIETWDLEVPLGGGPGSEGHKTITNNFVRAILKDEPLISPGLEGIRGLELGNAMLMSGITGKSVDLPMDGDAYDQMLKDLARKYGGKKNIKGAETISTDMKASMRT